MQSHDADKSQCHIVIDGLWSSNWRANIAFQGEFIGQSYVTLDVIIGNSCDWQFFDSKENIFKVYLISLSVECDISALNNEIQHSVIWTIEPVQRMSRNQPQLYISWKLWYLFSHYFWPLIPKFDFGRGAEYCALCLHYFWDFSNIL